MLSLSGAVGRCSTPKRRAERTEGSRARQPTPLRTPSMCPLGPWSLMELPGVPRLSYATAGKF